MVEEEVEIRQNFHNWSQCNVWVETKRWRRYRRGGGDKGKQCVGVDEGEICGREVDLTS